MAQLIKVDGTSQIVYPANRKCFTLEELQKFVGGMVEHLRLSAEECMLINEEGKLHDLPLNEQATSYLETNYGWENDFIAGDALVLKYAEWSEGDEHPELN